MSEPNQEGNPKHGEAMSEQYWNPGEATVNSAFESAETSDNVLPPSYDESASMPLAGGDIKGTLPPAEPKDPEPIAVQPIQLNSIPPAQETTTPVVVVAQPTVQAINPYVLGAFPAMVTCPNCHQTGQTVVEKRRGVGNWVGCGAMCLFGCWLGCQFIPFCIEDLKDSVHTCSHCHAVIGVRSAF